jgi:hypothetical protein
MGVWDSINNRRTVSDWIIAVKVGIVIAARPVVVIAVAVGIISPARVTGADKQRGAEAAAAITVTIAITRAVGTTYRRIIGIVSAGTD